MHNQYEFGPFVLDVRERRLTRDGRPIHLQPRAFDVLRHLLENAGALVSKQEVFDAVWRETIVTDNSLTACIRQIRQALDDRADAPEYIETVPVTGYRFIAPVVSPDEKADEPAAPGPATTRNLALGAVVAVAAMGIVYFVWQQFAATPGPATQPETGAVEPAAVVDSGQWQNSIAVLPFVNLSGNPDNEFFSDGLSEEIINLLARIPTLKVIGRTSSFLFKDRPEDLREIGRQLGVKTLLEGSVRQSGERVRITAQLIDAADGSHIWSESYDRTLTDIFELQDDVASSIIDALQLHVGAVPTRGRPTVRRFGRNV